MVLLWAEVSVYNLSMSMNLCMRIGVRAYDWVPRVLRARADTKIAATELGRLGGIDQLLLLVR